MTETTSEEIRDLESQIFELTSRLTELRRSISGVPVRNYGFATPEGDATLNDLFGDQDRLMLIHNMGQGCRYCTLWADGFNGLLPHLESVMSVVLVSKDSPETQRRFANTRGWRFRLASHGGGDYIREQTVMDGESNMPGVVVYERSDGNIYRRDSAVFGPGDLYCALWPLLALAGLDTTSFTPQFSYWRRPAQLDDGGANLADN